MEGTLWAMVPTLIAIIFALITKQVFVSLFAGIFTGAMMLSGGEPVRALSELFGIMAVKIGPTYYDNSVVGLGNAGVLLFISELGIMVALMNKAGGAAALSSFLSRKVKSNRSAMLVCAGLGCTIFTDDYFNRLAVGTIMKPVADRNGVSRIKLAYIIGSVSVSICLLIPISSWASAITGNIGEGLREGSAFELYLKTLSCNFYPILTLLIIFLTSALDVDLFGMRGKAENKSRIEAQPVKTKGKSIDLILPILVLIACSMTLMFFTDDSEAALAMSGAVAIVFCLILYLPRKVMTLKEFTESFGNGFKSIGEVLIILVFAWTLTGVCERLDVATFIGTLTEGMGSFKRLLPAIMFLAAMGTAFSTGTAWGTFGILVPLSVPMFEPFSTLQILTVSAVLSGSVFGNQVSPISDSTILASSVCECDHMTFIKAQLPGAMMVAAIAFCGFLISGITSFIWLGWVVDFALTTILIIITAMKNKIRIRKKTASYAAEKTV